MKKFLLSMAAILTVSVSASAQEVSLKYGLSESVAEASKATKAPVSSIDLAMDEADYLRVEALAPRKSLDDGVYYQRPVGAMYVSDNNPYCYHYIPGLLPVTWKNMATDKTGVKWTQTGTSNTGETITNEFPANADGDYVQTAGIIANGYINSYYVPTMTIGDKEYKFSYNNSKGVAETQSYFINGDSILANVCQANKGGGYWKGFSDVYVFGTGKRNVSVDGATVECTRHSIFERFKKPLSTLYVSNVWFHFVSDATTKDGFLPEGKEMSMKVWKINDAGQITDELLDKATFTIADTLWVNESFAEDGETVDGVYGALQVTKKETDDFGSEYEVPFVFDDAFAIEFEGFDQEGVDFSLYMVDVKNTPTDYLDNNGLVAPTLCTFKRVDTGEVLDGLYYVQYISSTGANAQYARQYNAGVHLSCMYDIVNILDGFENMTAPVEGGAIYTELENENENGETETTRYATLQYETTLPRISTWEGQEGEDNYLFEDLPEWLTVDAYNDSYFEQYHTTLARIVAEPLPDGVKARKATFYVASARAGKSRAVTVIQGDESTPDAIVTVKDGLSKKTDKVYSLSGQEVNGNYRGIVIENGKKVVR